MPRKATKRALVVYAAACLEIVLLGTPNPQNMCYERRRAEASVNESAHRALMNAGMRDIVDHDASKARG